MGNQKVSFPDTLSAAEKAPGIGLFDKNQFIGVLFWIFEYIIDWLGH